MRPDITSYLDYRVLIRDLCRYKKISYRFLAQKTQIHTSWFSRVQSGNADFSPEQLYALAELLGIISWELEYLLLLGDYSRSGYHHHKSFVLQKIKSLQKKHQKVINRLSDTPEHLSETSRNLYYQEAVTAKIHMYLTIPKYRENVFQLSQILKISREKLGSELDKLSSLGIIKIHDGLVEVVSFHVHLDEDDLASWTNHMNWRLDAIQCLTRRDSKGEDYHFSSAFGCNPEIRRFVRERLRQLVVDTQKKISESEDCDQICYFGLDLYSESGHSENPEPGREEIGKRQRQTSGN